MNPPPLIDGDTPKRFTPRWKLVLSKRSMVAAYGVLALGLAFGTNIAQVARHGETHRWR
jgi:hypothetical protein